jgi:two-component sensor histidine kinase
MQRRNERFVERLPLVFARKWQAYAAATLLCAVALLLRAAAAPILPAGHAYVSFFPAVALACFLFGARSGVYAALLCGAAAWYFFMPPTQTFSVSPEVIVAMLFYTGVVAVDISLIRWMQRANYTLGLERERTRGLAETHALLFRELQHRVSNNLQVVAALLTLQRRSIADEGARKALDEASARLALVGKISRSLYDPAGQGQTIRAFLEMLGGELLEASGRGDIALFVEAPRDLTLEPDVTMPIALIFAEAVSNALEHGFAERHDGRIAVLLRTQSDGALTLVVADDGPGVPTGFDPVAGGSLGLKIATTLANQLGGRFTMKNAPLGGGMAVLDIPARAA